MGFSNFYRRFIQNYSTLTSPLTNLLRNKPKSLSWSPAAEEAFEKLKEAFTWAPIFIHPDPERPLIVEVDASTTGVGAILSQQQGNSAKLHPCAFFSRKLSPAERNYDIGNRELLAIKLALEEWRHWLEGAQHPFTVLTDHKNLQYLREAKRLNPRQARWALFFTRFHYTITYNPGHKNIKADALSRLHALVEEEDPPESIIPESIFVCPIQWNPESAPSSNASTASPPGCPPGAQYITRTQRTLLIHSAHSSLGTGHPGANATLSLLKDRYWWPNMAKDVRRFVQGCEECAKSKSPHHLPAGKLFPLPIPNRPWSHLGVDFVKDLPASDGNTGILVVVDRFSKSCRLIPLKRLPTAMETAELMFNHVFRYFGIPEDIVSDRGPQFISRVWKSFFKLLGVTDSRNWKFPANLLPRPPALLEPVHWLGQVRSEFPPANIYWTHSLPVHTRVPATHVPLGWGAIGCSCGGLLVPRERKGLGWSTPSPSTSSMQVQNDSRPSKVRCSIITTWTEGLAVNTGHPITPALQEARSQIRWPLHHPKADQRGHLPAKPTSTIQKSLHIPCLTPQTLPLSCFLLHRAWLDHGNPSPADPGGWSHLRGQSDPGFPTSWW